MQEVGGSIPPSSTNSFGASQPLSVRLTPTPPMIDKILGRYTVFFGIALVAVGMLVGFGAMLVNPNSVFVKAIGLVPVGFIFLLTGTVVALLGSGNK